MTFGEWLFVFEFGGAFAAVMGFCWWQLRQLDKLDEQDRIEAAKREDSETS